MSVPGKALEWKRWKLGHVFQVYVDLKGGRWDHYDPKTEEYNIWNQIK